MIFGRRQLFQASTHLLVLFGSSCWVANAQQPTSFIPVTPCRVVDTREATGIFGGPMLAAGSTRTFPITHGACNIPNTAVDFSFVLTVVPPGSLPWVTVFPSGQPMPTTSSINSYNGLTLANSVLVPAGSNGSIDVYAREATHIILDVNGYFVAQATPTCTCTSTSNPGIAPGTENTAIGISTLQNNDTVQGTMNTAMGAYALSTNNAGKNNTAVGASALSTNSVGNNNTAIGFSALFQNAIGIANTALGSNAMLNNLGGDRNTAVGFSALNGNMNGFNNVAVGANALENNATGNSNIALGYGAGSAITSGNSNIDIGNSGAGNESGVIRIGSSQGSTYIAGIANSTLSGTPVVITSNGQLGIPGSSARFKTDIEDINNSSDALLALRPVKFYYRASDGQAAGALQYGLIAEDVEKIYPELVLHDAEQKPFAVAYQELPALLLNELQKQRRTIDRQNAQIAEQEQQLQKLAERLAKLENAQHPPQH
jgi:hypothetical protein